MEQLNVNAINPYIRVAMHSILSPRQRIGRRVIFDYELIYIERGPLQLWCGGQDYTCQAGQFLLLRPGIPHTLQVGDTEVSQPHIHFDLTFEPDSSAIPVSFRDLDRLTPEEKTRIRRDCFRAFPTAPCICFLQPQAALQLLYGVIEAHSAGEALFAKAQLTQLLYLLITDNFPGCLSPVPSQPVARQIKDYIDAGQGLSMSLVEFEKQFSYSRFHLERQFKNSYGVSLIEYRNRKRLQTACGLLATHSVSEIGRLLGFSSVYAFSRAFKNHFGVSPTQWKKPPCDAAVPAAERTAP